MSAMLSKRHPPPRRRAFTLVELLAVIAIVGILAAVLVPVVQSARHSANRARCAANMRLFLQAVPMYVAENRGRLPECVHGGAKTVEVRTQLAPYLAPPDGLTDGALFQWAAKIGCTAEGWVFGYNSWTSELPLLSIENPSRLIYGIDTTGSRAIRPVTFTALPNDFRQKTPRPHQGRVNAGYLDGHVVPLLASSLTWADFTRGTPSYSTSHDTRMVTTAAYDK